MKPYVEVQFSGNPKLYGYLIPAFYAEGGALAAVQPADRVVVISKMKDDNTPSLSIATIINVGECDDIVAQTYKPFVQLVPKSAIASAVATYSTVGAAG